MESFLVRKLAEKDIDAVLERAGGKRAHPDADRRDRQGADYVLGDAVLELKALDDEGLGKAERQVRLASLFRDEEDERPVVVIDRDRLTDRAQAEYDKIMQGPIKGAVSSANKQLKQSRREFPETKASILFIINNGYTALDHDELRDIVVRRVRNDTHTIDGVVVAGCYFQTDTFDYNFVWPIDYVPINVAHPFREFEQLREAWNAYADTFMTAVIQGDMSAGKGPVNDLVFEVDKVTFVKPAPRLGNASAFFVHGRPRRDSLNEQRPPSIATTFAVMTQADWVLLKKALPDDLTLHATYERWKQERATAVSSSTKERPLVAVPVTFAAWREWVARNKVKYLLGSVGQCANDIFNSNVRALMEAARERKSSSILPSRNVLAVTEVIGQDRGNDLSHIAAIREVPGGEPHIRELVRNARIFHEHAVALAAAYAFADGAECVLWKKRLRYAWS